MLEFDVVQRTMTLLARTAGAAARRTLCGALGFASCCGGTLTVAADVSGRREPRPVKGSLVGGSGPEEAAKGVVEGLKGKVKTLVGAVVGRDDLFREGRAQQDKAESQRDAAKKEAEAESARAAAQVAEKRQRANQSDQ